MSTNLKSKKEIQDSFNDVFSFDDEKDELKHQAHILMFRFLSEVEKVMDEKKLRKKDLAKIIGTSPSYVTQLFRGDKLINLETLAKLEKGLNLEFGISVRRNTETVERIDQESLTSGNNKKVKRKQKKIAATSS